MTLPELVKKSLSPLIYANFIAMAMSGLSLLMLGHFSSVWPGVAALLVSPLFFPFLLVPAALFSGLMAMFAKNHPALEKLMMVLSIGYLITLLTAYAMMAFSMLGKKMADANLFIWPYIVPAMIYGASSAVLPWLILAAKDRENVFFTGLVFMTEVTAVVIMCLSVWQEWVLAYSAMMFWCMLALLMCAQAWYEKYVLPKKQPQPENKAS